MRITTAEFVLGVANLRQLPKDSLKEVAFLGRSNVGKSSLINLIPRFYDVTNGQVRIDDDGAQCRKLKSDRLRRVPQLPHPYRKRDPEGDEPEHAPAGSSLCPFCPESGLPLQVVATP